MSVLDQAFIRAYTKDAPSVASERATETQQVPLANQPGIGRASPQPKVLSNVNSVFSGAVWHRSDQSHLEDSPVVQPHFQAPIQQQPQWISEQVERAPVVPPAMPAPAPDFNTASAWIMPPAFDHEPLSKVEAPAPQHIKESRKPVDFGRIDAKHAAPVPAPHFSLAPTRNLGSLESSTVEVTPELTNGSLDNNTTEEIQLTSQSRVDKATSAFNASWEVPNIRWPKVCHDLCDVGAVTFDEIVDALRDAIARNKGIVAVTSQQRGEGRTSVALCVARFAADVGISTVLVDADFSNPQIAVRTEMNVDEGWESALNGESALTDAAVVSIDDNLTILPLGKRAKRCQIGLEEVDESRLLTEISKSFDLVIVDTGPFPVEDANVFDTVLIVRDSRSRSINETDELAKQIAATGVEVVGAVENFG